MPWRLPVFLQLHQNRYGSYYPFGGTLAAISCKAAGALDNDRKYNGIELNEDLGLNTYDAFFRNLDPQIGRWWQIDPKIESMEMWSPYASNYNNPIRFSDPLGDEPCCQELLKDIKSAFKETGEAIYRGAVTVATKFNELVNPIPNAVELVTGKSAESGFTEPMSRITAAGGLLIALIPGGKVEGAEAKMLAKSVAKYEVGAADDLVKRSVVGDGLEIHHVSQSNPAGQIISTYDKKTAPAIALPKAEHKAIPTLKGNKTAGTPRQQLAKDIKDLRKNTNAPNSSMQQLIDLNKRMYPEAFKKPPSK
jgi:RHS repeat-associated protein